MRARLITKRTILEFVLAHQDAKISFQKWLTYLKDANWNIPADIKSTYGDADLLGKGTHRVVFNIGGNKYRMICSYYFSTNEVQLYVKWIGTHAEYSKLCDKNLQYDIIFY